LKGEKKQKKKKKNKNSKKIQSKNIYIEREMSKAKIHNEN